LITAIKDKNALVRWKVSYDDVGRAIKSEGPNGEYATSVSYQLVNNLPRRVVTNALGQATTFSYQKSIDGHVQLASVSRAAGTNVQAALTSFAYVKDTTTQNSYLSEQTDSLGVKTRFERNSRGLPTKVTEAFGTALARVTSISWDSGFNRPLSIAAPGLTSAFVYNANNQVTKITQTDTTTITLPYKTNGRARITSLTYGTTAGAKNKLISVDGPIAGTADTVRYDYAANGYLSAVTNEVGLKSTITAWDYRGNPTSLTDANGTVTSMSYDIHGQLTSLIVNPGAAQSRYLFEYDAVSNLSKMTMPGGGYQVYTYDSARRLIKITNEKNETIDIGYNALGKALSMTTKTGTVVTKKQSFEYDQLGRLLKSIGALPTQVTSYGYDKGDQQVSVTDARAKVWGTGFDALNRVFKQTNPNNQSTGYAYNGQDEVTSFSDGRGLKTQTIVDGFGDIIQETSPDRGVTQYWYDNESRLIRSTDADSVTTRYVYDASGRLTSKTFDGVAAESVTYGYDSVTSGNKGKGRLTSVTEQGVTSSFVYDAKGQMTSRTQVIAGKTYKTSMSYDANGQITQMTLPSGRVIVMARNSQGQLTALSTKPSAAAAAVSVASAVTYKPYGPLSSLTYGNGLKLTQTHDQNYWLTRSEVKATGSTALDMEYEYYNDGLLGEIRDNTASGRTVYIDIDASGRLTYANGKWGVEAYSYDASGNRTGVYKTVGTVSTTQNETIASTSNRLLSTTDAGGVVQRSFVYRQGGDLLTDTGKNGVVYTYGYNAQKRLVAVKNGTRTVGNYGYDFTGHRVSRIIHGLTNTTQIHYVYDLEDRLIGEYNGATGAVLREYAYVGMMAVAVFNGQGTGATTSYIHSGHRYEPLVMTSQSRTKVWEASVRPYGKLDTMGAVSANNDFRLLGQWHQLEAAAEGLSQNHYRDYDPSIGRYIQTDPLGYWGGQSLYAYVDGRPYDAVDPTGEFGWGLAFAGADLAWQLYKNGGKFECVNLVSVGLNLVGGGAISALSKGAFRFKTVGSNSWDASRKWMDKKGIHLRSGNKQRHHWLFERNQGIGKNVPDRIKNQPYNINLISSDFNNWLSRRPNLAWLGGPGWAGEIGSGGLLAAGAAITGTKGYNDCSCN